MRSDADQMTFPADFPKHDHYEDSFVVFLDILGFTERVRRIENEADFYRVARVLYILKKEADSWSGADESFAKDVQMTAVSDSVIVTMPHRNEVALYLTLTLVHQLQYALAEDENHTMLRGYIARGHVYHRNGILFGPGYLDAYTGESAGGGPPRIVLAPAIAARAVELTIRAHGDGRSSVLDLLRRDTDGLYFVDYLKPVGSLLNEPGSERIRVLGEIAGYATAQTITHADRSAVRSKYDWLVGYLDAIRREFYSR